MCRRHDAAALACMRTVTPVDRRAGSCWARARPEPERSRGSRWSSLRWRSSRALRLCFPQCWLIITIRSDTKKHPERPYTAPLHRGPARAARTLQAPAARVPSNGRRGGQPAWLCARRQVLMHRGGGTYCVSRPLAISGCRAARCDALHRAARGSRLAHVCCWLSAARQKTQDSYENE